MNLPWIAFVAGLLLAGLASQVRIRLLRKKVVSDETYIKFRIDSQIARLLPSQSAASARAGAGDGHSRSLRAATGQVTSAKVA